MTEIEGAFARGLRTGGEYVGHSFRHALENHGDPCPCPPELQRRWRGQRRLARLRRLWIIPRLWSRFAAWLEWQVGR